MPISQPEVPGGLGDDSSAAVRQNSRRVSAVSHHSRISGCKEKMSATVVAIAIALGLLVNGITGAQRFSGHTFRVTGAMYLASCGIDVWRIQLHCRWGSNSVLRYVRLAPLSGSVALEASLGRDLKHVERATVAAIAELAVEKSTLATQPSLRESLEAALGQTSLRLRVHLASPTSTKSLNVALKPGIENHPSMKSSP